MSAPESAEPRAARAARAALAKYDQVAERAADAVIRTYSTSFGAATRLLGPSVRADVRNIYALVRVADEIVDGAADGAGPGTDPRRLLDELEQQTLESIASGYSSNLIVHAFARTARSAGIDAGLITPFFGSMRADLDVSAHDAESLDEYVYGSAEVVGLMCLRVFLRDETRDAETVERLVAGARSLGSAFQKVNFLRDLAADRDGLGRIYFEGTASTDGTPTLDDDRKMALVTDIDIDLADARTTIPMLPASAKRAVTAAHDLFFALNRRISQTPATTLATTRIRVPGGTKLWLWLRASAGAAPLGKR